MKSKIFNFHPLYHINSINKKTTNYIFLDTETKPILNENNVEVQDFKLGSAIYWNELTDETEIKPFYEITDFWNFVFEKLKQIYKRVDKKDKRKQINLTLFAHNMEFDFNILKGYYYLTMNGFDLISMYIKNKVFILKFKKSGKGGYCINVLSTTNYTPKSLAEIGKDIGYELKMDIDFTTASDEYLMEYCIRDTKIIYNFIKQLLLFLDKHDFSDLKATAGSMALSTFRHKFNNHKIDSERIDIHDWKQAIKLERNSYHGGITDCYQIGKFTEAYKLDINSMYPSVMKNSELPRTLLLSFHNDEQNYIGVRDKLIEKEINTENLKDCNDIFKYFMEQDNKVCIVEVIADIDKDDAYILNKFDENKGKTMFGYGNNLKLSLCEPEFMFIVKSSKSHIKEINKINIYESSSTLFTEYVNELYSLRKEYKKENNQLYVQFTKLLLNTLYGKFGQKKTEYKIDDTPFLDDNSAVIEAMIESKKDLCERYRIVYLGKIIHSRCVYWLDGKILTIQETETNSENSLVAISSFITSYSRMMLVDFIQTAGKDNCYYSDTDSIICNKEGYENLLASDCIDEYQLGKLKVEGIGNCEIIAPKFYDFDNERKMKGIRKNSKLISETDKKVIYEVQYWKHTKHTLANGLEGKQIIKTDKKELNKKYDKGIVLDNGFVEPKNFSEKSNKTKQIIIFDETY